ncbi:hypothetical protein B0H10DRAFT_1952621 [Mycena sp. CBHHK59/15]|nr:hypothetical protein B0H10DRAFT_1952621 [Mycena sp. CBHHK59/15]
MPIQYHESEWFNNRPPHAGAKLGAQLIVAFVPNPSAFLSGRGDDAQTVKALTAKYGPEVFANYDLDYATKQAVSGEVGEQADSGDSGESVGSRDSTDESDGESAGSFISDDEEAMAEDEREFLSEDHNLVSFATSYDTDLEVEIFGDGNIDLCYKTSLLAVLPNDFAQPLIG